ncbi:MAG: acyl-CoA dehydrogenase family protein [Acidimicrobiia bacterium]
MDFSFDPDQQELQALARRILTDACTPARLKEVAASDSAIDLDLWAALADAGLVGIGLPEATGGGGLGFLETCIVLEEVARAGASVPALAVMALAGPALAGHPDLLDGVAAGREIVTAAITEAVGDPWAPTTTVTDGRISGTKVCVPAGLLAKRFVVSAADGIHVVEADAAGVAIERQDTTTGVPEARLTLDGAVSSRIGGIDALHALLDRGVAGACVMTAGLCDAALRLTAEYARTRTQFDRVIASFQAVSQRAADAYIDNEGVRLTAWQAAWRVARGMPAAEQLLTAKFWAAEGGQRVVHAAHHIHGGMGVDRDYPLHRHFLLAKQLELQLGSATPSLQRLGRLLATST